MQLSVEPRVLLGKKNRQLRKNQKVPGVVYGRHLDAPVPLVFDRVQLVKIIQKAGQNTPVELQGEGIDYLILFQDVQYHPVTDAIIHVDCIAVNKDEKTNAEVPITLIGESPFEKNNLGRIQLLKTKLEVEALPLDLPHDIKIDISRFEKDGEVFHISDLIVSDKVVLLDDPSLAILSTVAFKEEIEEEEEIIDEEEGGEGEGEKEGEEESKEKE